jgi:formate dehydrogenase
VNTARGAIVVKEDVAEALQSGHLRGYGGDVWDTQPAPKDHPLRYAQHPWSGGNAMVPHMSGTSIDAQKRLVLSLSRSVTFSLCRRLT